MEEVDFFIFSVPTLIYYKKQESPVMNRLPWEQLLFRKAGKTGSSQGLLLG